MAMEKRARFQSRWLPYALILPQLAITLVFFFWPAGQAVYQSIYIQDPFGGNLQFVGLDNFRELFNDEHYLASFKVTALFSVLVAALGLSVSLVLAVFADRVVRGAMVYKTLLIWPYAVAPAIAAVLWVFLFNPSIGIAGYWLNRAGVDWNYVLNGNQALLLVVMAAVWKQISYNFLFFLAGLQSIPKSLLEAAAIDGAGRSSALSPPFFRCSRRQHSSCSSSTWSMRSSTRSGSSTPRPPADPDRPRKSWSTSSTRMASRGSTSAAPVRSR
jgi:sn-glycerol 3-phosphate transport system permease protein